MPLSVIKTNSLGSSAVTVAKIADSAVTDAKLLDGTITRDKFAVDPTPTGTVGYFGYTDAPAGWLKANGAEVSRTTYATLFDSIGTTFGSGDGSTTFNLPDLRGEFPRGWDDSRGVDSARAIGSSQEATGILNYVNNNGAVSFQDHDGTESGGTSAAASASVFNRSKILYRFRPRNVALLACIKY